MVSLVCMGIVINLVILYRSCVEYIPRGDGEEWFCDSCQSQPKKISRDSKERQRGNFSLDNEADIDKPLTSFNKPHPAPAGSKLPFKGIECLLTLITNNIIMQL